MNKSSLKKSVRKRLKSWQIGDYIRQFSIVTGGVLLTLWLTGQITQSSKRKEIRQTMQIVTLELRDNLEIIRKYQWLYQEEKRIARQLQEHHFSLDVLPADTMKVYWRRIANGMGKPYRFQTDALEMFKTAGIASEIADKQIVIDLLRCYSDIGAFDNSMALYYDQRSETLVPRQIGADNTSEQTDLYNRFTLLLADKTVQGWLKIIPHAFNAAYFDQYTQKLETIIAELEKRYR